MAALAGVSASTVSSVVRGRGNVREETRRRVQDAIDELGYRPNLAARRLRSGRSHVMGLVLPSVTVPYFRECADAVLREAQEHGMSVRITQTHGDVRRERGVCDDPYLRHVDGILLVPISLGQEDMRALTVTKPLIVATASSTAGRVDSFDTDLFEAARAVVAHLVAGGRRRIAALAPGEVLPAERDERYQGYVAGLRDAGLPVSRRRVVSTETVTFAAGARAARTLVQRAPETDAVFALGKGRSGWVDYGGCWATSGGVLSEACGGTGGNNRSRAPPGGPPTASRAMYASTAGRRPDSSCGRPTRARGPTRSTAITSVCPRAGSSSASRTVPGESRRRRPSPAAWPPGRGTT
ncbi:LacI family DNA-binding transcriptional regulator [Streptomyces hygroscopicus]|uniref:LacI family DNA-binding transcriptional regulator n=1 Tax=Streptomyces hygroscopicus TaxID=1912 RepID=UPI0033C50443